MKIQQSIFQKADQLFNFDFELEQVLLNIKEISDQIFWLEIYLEYVRKIVVPYKTHVLDGIVINRFSSELLYIIHQRSNCVDQLVLRLHQGVQQSSLIELRDLCILVKQMKNREELVSTLNDRFVGFIDEIVHKY